MPDTQAALALLVALTGTPFAADGSKLILADVTGEARIETPARQRDAPLPAIPLGSRVSVVSGSARIECDVPVTVWLEAANAVDLLPAGPDAQWRRGLVVRGAGSGPVDVSAGPSRIILDPGDEVALRRLASDRVSVEVLAGFVEVAGPGWRDVLTAGEQVSLHAGAAGFSGEALDMERVTTSKREQGGLALITVRSPQLTVAQAIEGEPAFSAPEKDLRSAVGAKPFGERFLRQGRPEPARSAAAGRSDAVEMDRALAAVLLGMVFFAAWSWARKVA